MSAELQAWPLWLTSPLALLGAGLLLAQVLGLLLAARGLPRLYGAVASGLLLGVSGAGLIDAAVATQFQELFNAATALVLFEVGRKMDLAWLWRSRRQGASLLLACLLRGTVVWALLAACGLRAGEAGFMAAILSASSPIIHSSMVADARASGVTVFAGANLVGLGNVLALLALAPSIAWLRTQVDTETAGYGAELVKQLGRLAWGAAIALLCYGLYALATRLSRARAHLRPGMLLAALLMDLGLCSVSAASALLSLLLMGVLLRNAEKRDNVFQAELRTGQDIGYALLFMLSASLVQVEQLWHWQTLLVALTVFAARVAVTRLALAPATAWGRRKKPALALSMYSLVSFGSLMVDNSMAGYPGLSEPAQQIMAALLALNVLLAPGLTWYGLHLAGENHEEELHE
ncbi:NhaP-type Na+/H+ or K+/H+ antiporter [Duganella sacchari]|uniref:NhaP-type Na+/H+ or K+/H+ antiporter n=1 Tax=Duganella sacchari TaxID=551987 RepID=A0A1M7NNW3_9BURK|nr:cation:proton antiporter [Duganella sacchari]SHN05669.1 NhaP-type Na+/H+ or K+/H+ antiporter [Duganella sacchari]